MKKPELLAPAGNLEKLKYAISYGADAVYLAGQAYGLRAKAGNFTAAEMKKGIEFAHSNGKKVYATLNIFAHNQDFAGLEEYIKTLMDLNIDGAIAADPGIISVAKAAAPDLRISLSTQANNTNYHSANFWYQNGVKRIVLAREMSIEEISQIRANTPSDLELEAFVHGAMCMSYSGRCLLSNYMANRDANRGDCAQPCRWNYTLMEEKRQGEHFPVYEDARGTYIFNSKDLCMIKRIPELVGAGIDSFKIEGRMKSLYYVATVVGVYRRAIDAYFNDPEGYSFNPEWFEEVQKVSHRGYTEGFAFEKPGQEEHNYSTSSYIRNYDFTGSVLGYDKEKKLAKIEVRNKIFSGETMEIMSPGKEPREFIINQIIDEEGSTLEDAPHPKQIIYVPCEEETTKWDLLRREIV
ncbi:peptidase U32 family protein [Alkalibacter saccharofermentans]|uniref:Putative protease n=1 Tax=Alkalibacter saccharofermentans DSM 14828 TaxID=1120975 RepID=A0A1M4S7Y9_9FIRM|nr:U32 family peptidase [Alkalibacter saccharofermentans]SHE28311.1 putative protease [Alkalibacter saccharofermentans DSM 14828]